MSGDDSLPSWKFIPVHDRGVRQDDPSADLFFEKLPAIGAVIRESAQNSLDAGASEHEPVRMRISVHSGEGSMPSGKSRAYLDGLLEHLQESGFPRLPSGDESMPYMVVEDFGTKGLEGDTRVFSDSDSDDLDAENFYWFHRNNNRTQAFTKRGGSFGYGKASFALASRVRSFLTVSRTRDGSTRVFGSSIAKIHNIDGIRYPPYGDFGYSEDSDQGIGIVPDEAEAFFQRVVSDFELERSDEPGLSVIIPYPEDIYDSTEILESFIRNYFLPICEGKLEVEVCENGRRIAHLNTATILGVTSRLNWESNNIAGAMTSTNRACMVGLLELALWWSSGRARGDTYELDLTGSDRVRVFTRDSIPENLYPLIRENLEDGRPVAVKIKVPIVNKLEDGGRGAVEQSWFTVLIQRGEAYGHSDAVWIRRYISVPKPAKIPRKPGYVAIVMSLDGALEGLLRQSEEVAHTEHRKDRLKEFYFYGAEILRFYRESASHLIEFLTIRDVELEDHWLDDWFPSEEPTGEQDKPKKRRRKRRRKKDEEDDDDDDIDGPPPPPEDLSRHHPWELMKTPGGFIIEGEVRHDLDVVFKVKTAYARDDGADPFRKWKKFDFELDEEPFAFESDHATTESVEGNILTFRVEGPSDGYSISVTGFDTDRDLKVHAVPTMKRREVME